MPWRAMQGFLDSVFKLANIPLVCPHDTCISRQAKEVEVSFKTKARRANQHFSIDATGLKVYGEGEWKVKKHGTDGKRRVWRKLHIAVNTSIHEIVAAELSLSNVADAEVLPNLLKRHVIKSLRYQVMVLMIQMVTMMLYESNERFRLSSHEQGQPSENVGILTI